MAAQYLQQRYGEHGDIAIDAPQRCGVIMQCLRDKTMVI